MFDNKCSYEVICVEFGRRKNTTTFSCL